MHHWGQKIPQSVQHIIYTHYDSVIYCIQKYFIIQKSILLCITYDNTCIYNSYLGLFC